MTSEIKFLKLHTCKTKRKQTALPRLTTQNRYKGKLIFNKLLFDIIEIFCWNLIRNYRPSLMA